MVINFLLKQCNQEDRVTPQNTDTKYSTTENTKIKLKKYFFSAIWKVKEFSQTEPHYKEDLQVKENNRLKKKKKITTEEKESWKWTPYKYL